MILGARVRVTNPFSNHVGRTGTVVRERGELRRVALDGQPRELSDGFMSEPWTFFDDELETEGANR